LYYLRIWNGDFVTKDPPDRRPRSSLSQSLSLGPAEEPLAFAAGSCHTLGDGGHRTRPATDPSPLRYRNRVIDEQALADVRAIVEKTWGQPRREMALALCREWGWRKVGGGWAEYARADLLRKLARRWDIELPRPRRVAHGQSERPSHPTLPDDLIALPWWPVRSEDVDLADLEVRPVETDEREGWRRYMDRYHYLGYRVMVGEHLMYAAFLYGEVVA